MNPPIRIAIVDDDPFVIQSFTARVADAEGLTCVGIYSSAEDYISEHRFTNPDIVFMDVGLPGMSGIECIRFIKSLWSEIHFIVYSVFEDSQTVLEAIKAGASGYLLKSASLDKLVNAVHEVLRGESPLTGSVATTVMAAFRNTSPLQQVQELDPEEKILLAMLTEGYRYKDIGGRFGQTERMVKEKIRTIYQKLHINESNLMAGARDPLDAQFGRYLNTAVKPETEEECYLKIKELFEEEKPYLTERYSISKLAMGVGFPVYVVSQTINRRFRKNFFDLINHYRILEAAILLKKRDGPYSIDGIAAICGFNSRPPFYKAFRKEFGMTPGEYEDLNSST
jgi:DNA-binding NarL/FixJ family response regulator